MDLNKEILRMESVMSITKTIHYKTIVISVTEFAKGNGASLGSEGLDKLRRLYFFSDHKIPRNNIDFGCRLIRTTVNVGELVSRIPSGYKHLSEFKDTVAFFTASVTMKSSVSSYIPPSSLVANHRFDPYMSVIWIREFAHDPWEDPISCVDWVIHMIKDYIKKYDQLSDLADSGKLNIREIIWRVSETYLGLQEALLGRGFIMEAYYPERKKLSFSLIL